MEKIKIGIAGAGSFARCFIPLFKAHPNVESIALADLNPERLAEVAEKFGINETYPSHDALCESNVDAIAIITQRQLHGPQAVLAMNSGKHVYSAVPAGISLEELEELIKTVEATGLTYMMGETSYYYPAAIFCREKLNSGEMGDFVYGEGEYLHDMSHGFYKAFQHSGGKDWKQAAGLPPMYYSTHSASMIISVTGQKLVQVSCLGYKDKHNDNIFGAGKNFWDNPFSNQTALFRTSGGGMCRLNEFRRIGQGVGNSVRTSIYGTNGCFEQQGDSLLWSTLDKQHQQLNDTLLCSGKPLAESADKAIGQQEDFYTGVSKVHPVERLPKEFASLANGHSGSHQFLVDDFIRAVIQDRLPPNHIWATASYTVPGLVAHQSALQNGKTLEIPDMGNPPAGKEYIDLKPY